MKHCIHAPIWRAGTWLLVTAALALTASCFAQADVKIVATINATGMPAPPADRPADAPKPPSFPQTMTAYYKGSHARVQEGNGAVSLYDFTTGTMTRLDPAKKTYFTVAIVQMPGGPGGNRFGPPPMEGAITLTAAGGEKTIAGKSASSYTVSGSLSPKGGFPGGPPPSGGQRGTPPKDTITGKVWFSSGVTLTSDSKYAAMPLVRLLVFMAGPAAKPLGDALNAQKMIPLESAITVTHPLPPRRDAEDQGPSLVKITTTMTVISLSQRALDASLFQPPSGYTQVDPPQRRPMGPPPGEGGPDGPGGPPPDGGGPDGQGGPPPDGGGPDGGPMGPPPSE